MNCDADVLLRMNWNTVESIEVKTTVDLAQIDRMLILDSEIRGHRSIDAAFVMDALSLGDDTQRWIRRSLVEHILHLLRRC